VNQSINLLNQHRHQLSCLTHYEKLQAVNPPEKDLLLVSLCTRITRDLALLFPGVNLSGKYRCISQIGSYSKSATSKIPFKLKAFVGKMMLRL
ncbi:MAG: hypothetical protein AAFX51_16205, partial [Cyanobacteria bacterium J06636_28]